MRIKRRIAYWDLWLICMMGGVLTGTIWANLLSRELLGQIGFFDGLYQTGRIWDEGEKRQLWRYVIKQRLGEAGLGGLIAMTPFAAPGYLLLAFGGGFAVAAVISVFTLEKGSMGILYWLISVLPHGICYLVAAMVMTAAVSEKENLKKIRVWLAVGACVALGTFLEAWTGPELMKITGILW